MLVRLLLRRKLANMFAEKPYTLSKSDTEVALAAVKKAGVKTAVENEPSICPQFSSKP